jgi:hypothetical protein
VFSFTSLSFTKRVSLFLSSLFDVKSSFTTASIILVVLGTVLSALNATLLYSYMRVRGEVIMASGFYSGIGLILAFLGIGCASCGTAFLTFLLSFFGGKQERKDNLLDFLLTLSFCKRSIHYCVLWL